MHCVKVLKCQQRHQEKETGLGRKYYREIGRKKYCTRGEREKILTQVMI